LQAVAQPEQTEVAGSNEGSDCRQQLSPFYGRVVDEMGGDEMGEERSPDGSGDRRRGREWRQKKADHPTLDVPCHQHRTGQPLSSATRGRRRRLAVPLRPTHHQVEPLRRKLTLRSSRFRDGGGCHRKVLV